MPDEDESARNARQRASDAEREAAAERIRTAAFDGRLGLDELDERLGSALTARTRGELAAVTSDLDDALDQPVAAADEITVDGSSVQRVGRWNVPRRLVVKARMSNVVLDFVEAVFDGPTSGIEVDASASALRLVVPDDVAVEVAATPRFSSVNIRLPERRQQPRAVIRLDGAISMSSITVTRPGWWRRRRLRKAARRALQA